MRRANLLEGDFEYDPEDPEGYRSGQIRLEAALGAAETAIRLYEIPPGESCCPYHYEYVEEWLLILEGDLLVRSPAGEEPAQRGDLILFPSGPEGAHKITNTGTEPARALMFSSSREPSVAVYPDSDKIGVWPGREQDTVMLRRADGQVPYYDGEA